MALEYRSCVRFPGLDQPLRRDCRRRTVRHGGAGHRFAFWLHAHLPRPPLAVTSDSAAPGHQVRDAIHIDDLAALVVEQLDGQLAMGRRALQCRAAASETTVCRSSQLTRLVRRGHGRHDPPSISNAPDRPVDLGIVIGDCRPHLRAALEMASAPLTSIEEIVADLVLANRRALAATVSRR